MLNNNNWRPTASVQNLKLRAGVFEKTRDFFKERGVLEVETPLLSSATVPTPHLQSLKTFYQKEGTHSKLLYLQTSPEFGMKRLLAVGSGPIYQICKAFRDGESGRHHNPEFTMLEWYRPEFNHHHLMREVDEFLQWVLNTSSAQYVTYADIFHQYLNIDPHRSSLEELKKCGVEKGLNFVEDEPCLSNYSDENSRDLWLQLLMTHFIEPYLGYESPIFIYDFPSSQAALAKVRKEGEILVAERFEVYIKGIELANGYHELTDVEEQTRRFEQEIEMRKQQCMTEVALDHRLLAALSHLPSCAGVALGMDRLVMLAAKAQFLSEIVSFTVDCA